MKTNQTTEWWEVKEFPNIQKRKERERLIVEDFMKDKQAILNPRLLDLLVGKGPNSCLDKDIPALKACARYHRVKIGDNEVKKDIVSKCMTELYKLTSPRRYTHYLNMMTNDGVFSLQEREGILRIIQSDDIEMREVAYSIINSKMKGWENRKK